jgi:thioredoxin 1
MDNAQYVTLTDANFDAEVAQSSLPVLVDFGAEWCPPCRIVEPLVEEIASEYAGHVKVGKMNIDHNPDTAATFGIRGVPTILFFRDGEIVDRVVGAVPKSTLVDKVKQLMAA